MGAAQIMGTVFAEEYTVKSVRKNFDRYSKPYQKVVMADDFTTEYRYVFEGNSKLSIITTFEDSIFILFSIQQTLK